MMATTMIAVAVEGTHLRHHLHHVGAVSRLAIAAEATVDLSPSLMLNLHACVMDNVVASISLELSRVSGTFARTLMCMHLLRAVSPSRRSATRYCECKSKQSGSQYYANKEFCMGRLQRQFE